MGAATRPPPAPVTYLRHHRLCQIPAFRGISLPGERCPDMRLLLVRHAIAEEREDFARTGKDDHLRPLTDEGRKKMKQAARGLRSLVPEIDLLATSPLTRAAQTGAILDSVYGGLDVVETDELSPETTPEQFLRWLRQQKGD